MHRGQSSREKQKALIKQIKVNLTKTEGISKLYGYRGGEFINFMKIGRNMQYASLAEGDGRPCRGDLYRLSCVEV